MGVNDTARTAPESGMRPAVVSAILAASLAAILTYWGALCLDERAQTKEREALLASLIYEIARNLEVLERPASHSAIGTVTPSILAAEAALANRSFYEGGVTAEMRLAMHMFVEKVRATQLSLEYHRSLLRQRVLTDDELDRLLGSCHNALASTKLLQLHLGSYPRHREVLAKVQSDTQLMGVQLDSLLRSVHPQYLSPEP